jgi:hypothetical protein
MTIPIKNHFEVFLVTLWEMELSSQKLGYIQ